MATVKKINEDVPDVVLMPKEDFEMPELKIILPKEEFRPFCPHDKIRIWEYHRIVECYGCGERLDPFDYLLNVGKKENNKLSELKWLGYQVKHKNEEIEKLKKEISKLNSLKRKAE